MRHLATLAVALFLVGCNSDGLQNGIGSPGGAGGGGGGGVDSGGGGGGGGGGGSVDLAVAPVDPGKPEGGACKTACDCQDGLVCQQNKCTASMLGKLHCCESADCTSGFCQSKDGSYGQCGTGGGGGGGGNMRRDMSMGNGGGGGGQFCAFVPCSADATCKQLGCGSCDLTKKVCAQ